MTKLQTTKSKRHVRGKSPTAVRKYALLHYSSVSLISLVKAARELNVVGDIREGLYNDKPVVGSITSLKAAVDWVHEWFTDTGKVRRHAKP